MRINWKFWRQPPPTDPKSADLNRRAVIEAWVQGSVARLDGKPPDNPYPSDPQGCNPLYRAWREGYYGMDLVILGESQ